MKYQIVSINEVRDRAEKRHSHFFDTDTMRFFKSRVSEECYKVNDDIYFITSERRDYTVSRYWTIRKCSQNGDIDTIGKFQQYESKREAKKSLLDLIGEI